MTADTQALEPSVDRQDCDALAVSAAQPAALNGCSLMLAAVCCCYVQSSHTQHSCNCCIQTCCKAAQRQQSTAAELTVFCRSQLQAALEVWFEILSDHLSSIASFEGLDQSESCIRWSD